MNWKSSKKIKETAHVAKCSLKSAWAKANATKGPCSDRMEWCYTMNGLGHPRGQFMWEESRDITESGSDVTL